MEKATRVVRSRLTAVKNGDPFAAPPVFAGPFHLQGEPSSSPYTYGRFHNPAWAALEEALSDLESAEAANGDIAAKALVFPSGMAAVMAVLSTTLRPGGVIVLPASGYYTVRLLIERFLEPMGVEMRVLPKEVSPQEDVLRGATLLWLETPTNPELEIYDIRAWGRAAHAAGALVAVDNTTATPLGQNVLSLGADYSVVSGTKALTGHADLVLGHAAVIRDDLYAKILEWRRISGSILGPMEAWLALRSLPTLPLRLEKSSANALAIARFLEGRNEVVRVMYPGLPSHPGHTLAAAQMSCFGPVVSFVLKDLASAEKFLGRSALVTDATSFGSMTTTAERRGRWEGDAVAPGLIRMSAGCEAIEDIFEDLKAALEGL